MLSVVALLFALVAPPQAVATVVVPPNTPFKIVFEHDGQFVDGFRWWCNGKILQNFAKADFVATPLTDRPGMFDWTATVNGLPLGTYSCQVTAYNANAESLPSAPIAFPATATPATPLQLRIVVEVKR